MFLVCCAMNDYKIPNSPQLCQCMRIYNIVDDDPAPRDEVFAYARELVEKKWPNWAEHNTSTEKAISYNQRGEKRVSNERIKKELGVRLLHSSYRSGLLNIIDQMEYPSSSEK
ncbi:uncharacterized protein LOC126655841 [Mercurialis annua]|uniref:uncharacterized protein LOC126655841 n=1 Tax=Mercurialis annua TaxID=3986 RepID=UPI00215EE8F1|nr:uncharacterized protein LOC126655841 [Mercurialis annua]